MHERSLKILVIDLDTPSQSYAQKKKSVLAKERERHLFSPLCVFLIVAACKSLWLFFKFLQVCFFKLIIFTIPVIPILITEFLPTKRLSLVKTNSYALLLLLLSTIIAWWYYMKWSSNSKNLQALKSNWYLAKKFIEVVCEKFITWIQTCHYFKLLFIWYAYTVTMNIKRI